MKSKSALFILSLTSIGIAHTLMQWSMLSLAFAFGSLYQMMNNSKQPVQVGCLWVCTAHCLILLPVAQVLIDFAYGPLRLLLFVALIGYIGFVAVFFLSAYVWSSKLKWFTCAKPFLFSGFLTAYYFFLMDHSLPLIGIDISCAFFYPLLPALYQQTVLNKLISFSQWGTVFLFIWMACCAYPMSERKWRSCIAWAMLLLLQRGQHQQTPPEWIEHIGLVSLKSGCSKMGVWDEAEIILVELQKIMARSPAKKLIIAPESAFAHPLNNYPVFVSLWADYGLRECGLLIGSQREDQGVYNCAYFIKNGLIEQSYDKRKCLPFSEKPAGFFYEQIATFFSQESTQFKNGQQSCTVFNAQVPGMPFFQLRICSEFLCTHQAPAESLIVCLANDSWFCSQQGKNAMFSIAVLRAIQAKSAVLYVAHSIAAYIDQSGAAYLMKQ